MDLLCDHLGAIRWLGTAAVVACVVAFGLYANRTSAGVHSLESLVARLPRDSRRRIVPWVIVPIVVTPILFCGFLYESGNLIKLLVESLASCPGD
jgi:hypothetical protein